MLYDACEINCADRMSAPCLAIASVCAVIGVALRAANMKVSAIGFFRILVRPKKFKI
jgi:hypothetical protein